MLIHVCVFLRQEDSKHSTLDSSSQAREAGSRAAGVHGCMWVNDDILALGLNVLILSLIIPFLMNKNIHVWKNCKELHTFTNLHLYIFKLVLV